MNHSYETTCTDCTKTIEVAFPDGDISVLGLCARLCTDCRDKRVVRHLPLSGLSPQGGLGNYHMNVELQWPITEKDLEYIAAGDKEEDFARRSMNSIRASLGFIAGGGDTTPVAHYHLFINTLGRCVGDPVAKRPDGYVRAYHDALNHLAGLVIDLQEAMRPLGAAEEEVDFSNVFSALAVGGRHGWPIDERIHNQVRRAESVSMPLNEEEAKKRVKEWAKEKE